MWLTSAGQPVACTLEGFSIGLLCAPLFHGSGSVVYFKFTAVPAAEAGKEMRGAYLRFA